MADEVRVVVREQKQARGLKDRFQFLLSWVGSPLKTGAVVPSSKVLAAAMAAEVDPAQPGPVVELGPGTGPITQALIERGIAPERIVALEFNPDFVTLLRRRYPRLHVIEADAYALSPAHISSFGQKASAIVSSLPLTTVAPEKRAQLLGAVFAMMAPGAPFVQFTYAPHAPIADAGDDVVVTSSDWILKNVPPARVWTYRRKI